MQKILDLSSNKSQVEGQKLQGPPVNDYCYFVFTNSASPKFPITITCLDPLAGCGLAEPVIYSVDSTGTYLILKCDFVEGTEPCAVSLTPSTLVPMWNSRECITPTLKDFNQFTVQEDCHEDCSCLSNPTPAAYWALDLDYGTTTDVQSNVNNNCEDCTNTCNPTPALFACNVPTDTTIISNECTAPGTCGNLDVGPDLSCGGPGCYCWYSVDLSSNVCGTLDDTSCFSCNNDADCHNAANFGTGYFCAADCCGTVGECVPFCGISCSDLNCGECGCYADIDGYNNHCINEVSCSSPCTKDSDCGNIQTFCVEVSSPTCTTPGNYCSTGYDCHA